ncbi:MAG: histidinol dehydrogenase [Gemmatimonadetes bacterium]|nr:histidinol dehydrogenase [Gemmatimonadota bacterium]
MTDTSTQLFTGDVARLTPDDRRRLFDRGRASDPHVERAVRDLIDDVRTRGDTALREQAARFDGADLSALEVPHEACTAALAQLDAEVRAALELAARNIADFHRAQLPEPLEIEMMPGLLLGRRTEPIRSVGVYAPGGRAAYPSSVLMGVIPAKVAGVSEVVVCSPAGPDGRPPAAVLAACALAGADRVFAIGGAGAIAALALGTGSVPRVDKIVGPGNAYVTEAKRQLTGMVAIDSPAGPSEVLIIADDSADATLVAVELLAQAEHDPDAASVLVTTDLSLIERVAGEVDRLTASQPRAEIIRAALAARGALLSVSSLEDAASFSAAYAPEHLLVMTREPRALLPALRAAGTIFLGAPSSVAFGDYITGANHVLPTAGLSRAYAGLSTADFLRWTTYQELTPAAAAAVAAPTAALADAEGLPAHALAARLRSDGSTPGWSAHPAAETAASPVQLRAAYGSLSLYDPGRLPCAVDLSDNTSLFGPAPAVRNVIGRIDPARITRYPSVYATDLRQALADLHGVAPDNIATGCGSDDVIDSALRAFCEPGDAVAYPDPTFGMIPIFGRMNALTAVAVPTGDEFALDADALLATRARATYLCRPNNPTGTQIDRTAVERICRDAAGVVLIDEAYADYADDDVLALAVASDRALVMRTMSKAYGLAGLRVGYAVGPAHLIAEIEKSRGPYKVNGIAESAALAVLGERDWVADRIAEVRANRARLSGELKARGVRVWDSAANFLLMKVAGRASEWNVQLRERGVAVRPFDGLTGAGACIRVSVGPWAMMERFLDAFDEVNNTMAGE